MPNTWFKFKQFTIEQQHVAMKVGTDGVLLGAWADVLNASQALDIGTGTGVIALMIAQRNLTANITAIDIEPDAVQQARKNFQDSAWNHRLQAINADFCQFAQTVGQTFDCIVSNPPYFSNALASPVAKRQLARHTETLTHENLLQGVLQLLSPQGKFSTIMPYAEGNTFAAQAEKCQLFCVRKTHVANRQGSAVKRLLLEFSFEKTPVCEQWLYIRSLGNDFSQEYKDLTQEFYLKF